MLSCNYRCAEKLHRLRAQGEAGQAVHTKEPDTVPHMVVRDVDPVRVRHLRPHHGQHDLPGHEVPQPACSVHQGVGHTQHVLHCSLRSRVHPQDTRLQTEG